ncbi:KRAB-A domain-containing protein 2-like [Mytilus edulis]|uniref:KRAB-A domain-containing protein 2-like n=1 Tax=Mytilus edulis TaxID=6550 RepID=UPI0039F01F07
MANEKEKIFTEELLKMYNEKCDRVLMPKEKLNIIISRFNILCESETIKRTRDDYNLLSRYEVLQIAGLEKLIRKRKTEEDPILYFVSLEETFDVIKKSHSALNHAGRDKMQKKLNKKNANVTLSAINLYKSMCEECQLRRKNPAKGVVVKPILSKEFNSRGQVDLIDMQSMPDGDFKFIMNYQDHLTKFGVIESLSSKRAAEVAYKLLTNVFLVFGAPHILQSDNGREFTANIILELKQLWPELVIVHGKPRHPQSQGSVERSNGDVHDMLVSWMRDNKTTKWATGIKFVQFQKNRHNHSGIKRSPYEAMFGCPPKVGLASSPIPT